MQTTGSIDNDDGNKCPKTKITSVPKSEPRARARARVSAGVRAGLWLELVLVAPHLPAWAVPTPVKSVSLGSSLELLFVVSWGVKLYDQISESSGWWP